jgi:molybdate transport system regulatory protein
MKDETEASGMALEGSVWMTMDGQKLGGRDRVDLLAAVAEHGSITAAPRRSA